jgi:ribosomal protein L37E
MGRRRVLKTDRKHIRQRGKVYPEIAPDTPSKRPGTLGIMRHAYCTRCESEEVHDVVRAGAKCECGYPLSARALWFDENKYTREEETDENPK